MLAPSRHVTTFKRLGELTLAYDDEVSPEARERLEQFVIAYLRDRFERDAYLVRRVVFCPNCREPVPDRSVTLLRERGIDSRDCDRCGRRVSLVERPEAAAAAHESVPAVAEMARAADEGQDRAAAVPVIEGKKETSDYDMFFCYKKVESANVLSIYERLKERGILAWIDRYNLRAGDNWVDELARRIRGGTIKTIAVFCGRGGKTGWQGLELDEICVILAQGKYRVVPVMLPNCPTSLTLPPFLPGLHRVDFRQVDLDPFEQLVAGIGIERPGRGRR